MHEIETDSQLEVDEHIYHFSGKLILYISVPVNSTRSYVDRISLFRKQVDIVQIISKGRHEYEIEIISKTDRY